MKATWCQSMSIFFCDMTHIGKQVCRCRNKSEDHCYMATMNMTLTLDSKCHLILNLKLQKPLAPVTVRPPSLTSSETPEDWFLINMSLVTRKLDFCLCENKGAYQLRSNCEADQRLCFRYTDSTIPLLPKSEISSF